MANTLVRVAEVKAYPGVPAIPPQPKRCWLEVVGYENPPMQGSSSTYPVDYAPLPQLPAPQPGSGDTWSGNSLDADEGRTAGEVMYGNYTLVPYYPESPPPPPKPILREYCSPTRDIPGTAGSPPRVERSYGPDWRASARSVAPVVGAGSASFTPAGEVVVGLTTDTQDLFISGIAYGVHLTGGSLYLVVDGAESYLGPATAGARYTLAREAGHLVLTVDSGTKTVLDRRSSPISDPLYLAGFVYDDSAEVDTPVLTALSYVTSSGEAVQGLSATVGVTHRILPGGVAPLPITTSVTTKRNGAVDGAGGATLALVAPPVPVAVRWWTPGEGSLPIHAAGDPTVRPEAGVLITPTPLAVRTGNTSGAAVTLDPSPMVLISAGEQGVVSPVLSGVSIYPSPMALVATVLPGGVGSVQVSLPKQAFTVADYNYGAAALHPSPMAMFATSPIGGGAYYGYAEGLGVSAGFATTYALSVTILDSVGLETEADVLILLEDAIESAVALHDDLGFTEILTLVMEAGLTFSEIGTPELTQAVQYAYNAATQAVARIDGFDFDSLVQSGDYSYGVKADGIYRIRQGSDDGAAIPAAVDFGTHDFGGSVKKGIETAYIGMATDGAVYLRLTGDGGNEKVYRAIQREPTMRVRTGRGLTARSWRVVLQVVDATSAELDGIEFVLAASARRWTR